MEITITATEANRQFSKMLRGVRQGKRYVITSRGEPVAELAASNHAAAAETARREKAWRKIMRRLEKQPIVETRGWSRDDAYDEPRGTGE